MRSFTSNGAEPDVVVIGAGPSGLFAAAELARHGVVARVLERLPVPHRQTRATAIQPGTLELLARSGLVDEVLAASVPPGPVLGLGRVEPRLRI
jgi:2-polyprenyl-6-methoxyphenol hydroxylase-like FAD-dependent oxidoreductase